MIAPLEGTGDKFVTMEADVTAQEESGNAACQKDMTEQAIDKATLRADASAYIPRCLPSPAVALLDDQEETLRSWERSIGLIREQAPVKTTTML